jgi:hypothetical protein
LTGLIDPSLFGAGSGGEGGSPFARTEAPSSLAASSFRDPRPLTAWVTGFVYGDVVFSAVLAAAFITQITGLAAIMPGEDDADLSTVQATFSFLAMAYLAFSVVRSILILRWFWRANTAGRR